MSYRRSLERGSHWIATLPLRVLIGAIRLYQLVLSPLTGPTCKYYPTCSSYAITALRTHGALKGLGLALWRILRCNPWSLGGVDDVPPRKEGALQRPDDGGFANRQAAHVH